MRCANKQQHSVRVCQKISPYRFTTERPSEGEEPIVRIDPKFENRNGVGRPERRESWGTGSPCPTRRRTRWKTEVKEQKEYFHEFKNGKWCERKGGRRPFRKKSVTVYEAPGENGIILSAGAYACDSNGKNCAMKFQDEVESNLDYNLKWEAFRENNARRPTLGQAEPWMHLMCMKDQRIDELNFEEFVVRRDCRASEQCSDGVKISDNPFTAYGSELKLNPNYDRIWSQTEPNKYSTRPTVYHEYRPFHAPKDAEDSYSTKEALKQISKDEIEVNVRGLPSDQVREGSSKDDKSGGSGPCASGLATHPRP